MSSPIRRTAWLTTALSCVAGLLSVAPASAAPSTVTGAKCAPAKAAGGSWGSYGHDYSNSRFQEREHLISPGNAGDLTPAFSFSVEDAGGKGDVAGTPVVRFGCVYIATAGGWVMAFNADNGKLVWRSRIPDDAFAYGSVGVTRRAVYVGLNRTRQGLTGCPNDRPCLGPFAIALKRKSGERIWVSRPIDEQKGSETYSSPVIHDGVVLLGVSGGIAELTAEEEVRETFQGSLVMLSARSGRILHKTWTIHPPKRPDDDFAGGGIWGTPAIDRKAGVAYVGTANPYVPSAAHPRAGAVLKIGITRGRRDFGKIIAFGEGTPEEYLDLFTELPCIDFPGNVPPYPTGLGSCFDLDLDFGASPNLYRDADGRKVVGAGQKSGVYHVFDARTMEHLRETIVGPPSYFGGIVGSTAYDGDSVYGPITIPGYLWSIDADDGGLQWAAPVLDVLHWGPPVAVANGVVYSVDFLGYLNGVDARTGISVLHTPLTLGGESATSSWGGVAVARHTVYAAVGTGSTLNGGVVAFRLPR